MPKNQQITLIVRFKAILGKEEDVKNVLMNLIAPTRSEPGCIEYILHQNAEDETQFLFYEVWQDQYSLNQHNEKQYIKEAVKFFQENGKAILAEPISFTKWRVAD